MNDSATVKLLEYMRDVGAILKFYGVDNNCFKLDKMVFEAIQDEADGYRSYLDTIEIVKPKKLIFFTKMLDKVTIVANEVYSGYDLVSTKDDHVWLTVGTDYTDGYYPCFTFCYTPRKSNEEG